MAKYYTKKQLTNHWSRGLVKKWFPICTKVMANPNNRRGESIQLYDVNRVKQIEMLNEFKTDFEKYNDRRSKRITKLIQKMLSGCK